MHGICRRRGRQRWKSIVVRRCFPIFAVAPPTVPHPGESQLERAKDLLDLVVGQMGVGLGKFSQSREVVAVRLGNLKAAQTLGNVRLNFHDAVDFFQIASDRGGAAPSRHVRDFEGHQGVL